MTPDAVLRMAQYNRWMNQRLYEAALRLPEAEIAKDRGAFFGSLLATLNHIAVGDTIWLKRFAGHPGAGMLRAGLADFSLPGSLRETLAPTLKELQAYRSTLDELIVAWAGQITAAQLDGHLTYSNMAGVPQKKRFAALVQHFFNHQTHHRGQASTLLFQAGVDVGVTDLLAVIPDEA